MAGALEERERDYFVRSRPLPVPSCDSRRVTVPASTMLRCRGPVRIAYFQSYPSYLHTACIPCIASFNPPDDPCLRLCYARMCL